VFRRLDKAVQRPSGDSQGAGVGDALWWPEFPVTLSPRMLAMREPGSSVVDSPKNKTTAAVLSMLARIKLNSR